MTKKITHQSLAKANAQQRNAGFTLIETLIAIAVLVISILGPLQIASQALFTALHSRDEITAYYLAAEGIEYLKNARDSSRLYDASHNTTSGVNTFWLTNLLPCVASTGFKGCTIDEASFSNISASAFTQCPDPEGCPPLHLNETTHVWSYAAEDPVSRFTRTIELLPQTVNGSIIPEEAFIKVTVVWQGGNYGGEKKVVLYGYMTNWQRL